MSHLLRSCLLAATLAVAPIGISTGLGAADAAPTATTTAPATPAAGAPTASAPTAGTPTAGAPTVAAKLPGEGSYLARLKQQWNDGGWTMWLLLGMSLLGMACFLERLVNLRRRNIVPAGLAKQANDLYHRQDWTGMEALLKANPSTFARIIRYAVNHRDWSLAEVTLGVNDIAARDARLQSQRLLLLAMAATISPLLGLFGTILGMIDAFEVVAVAGQMGDPSLLSSSISKALITTAGGLIVAIPALFAWHFFRTRTSSLFGNLEEDASDLLDAWLRKTEVSRAGA